MGRPLKGRVQERDLAKGRTAYDLRVQWRGRETQYTLGQSPDWNLHRAEDERDRVVQLIGLDMWEGPPRRVTKAELPQAETDPFMNVVISDWWARGIAGGDEDDADWAPNTVAAYRHQLPYLAWWRDHRCGQVNAAAVEDFKQYLRAYRKADGKPLAVSYRNAILDRLAQVLDYAHGCEYVTYNAARVRGTKFKVAKKKQAERRFDYLNVDQLQAVLSAAAELEAGFSRRVSVLGKPYAPNKSQVNIGRVATLGLLFFAGVRVHEAGNLLWADVLLKDGVLRIRSHQDDVTGKTRESGKTSAGIREPNIVPALEVILNEWRTQTRYAKQSDFVIPTARGTHRSNRNIAQRIIDPVLRRAEERSGGELVLPPHFTSHWGRRTVATNLAAIGNMPDYIQDQLGHEDSRMAQEVYRQRQRRRAAPDPRLFELYGQPHHLVAAAE